MLDTQPNTRLDAAKPRPQHQPTSVPQPSGSRHGPRWFVVATHSQAERRADNNLRQQGYQTYLPMLTVRRRDNAIRSLLHRVEIPLFSGYLFVKFDAQRDPWRPITNTPGVYALLRSQSTGLPEPAPEAALDALRASDELRRTLTPPGAVWAPGTPLQAVLGGGQKVDAILMSITGQKAVVAALMFGALREITVRVDCLMARD